VVVKLVLDTNAYVRCQNRDETALKKVAEAEFLFLPVIVYGELYFGFKKGTRFSENIRIFKAFINQFNLELIEINQDIAERFAEILLYLKNKGKPIPSNDIWIAASTMSIGGVLLTNDAHFLDLPQIQVEYFA
jgi:tRNA(fMet)-specific endonuclease VapC